MYTIVCIVPWYPAVYKTSTTSIQSVGFTVTEIPFCFSELWISFACELLRATKSAWDFLGVNFRSVLVQGFFWVLLKALGIFLGLDFWLHSIIPVTWNPEYPPWGLVRKSGKIKKVIWKWPAGMPVTCHSRNSHETPSAKHYPHCFAQKTKNGGLWESFPRNRWMISTRLKVF